VVDGLPISVLLSHLALVQVTLLLHMVIMDAVLDLVEGSSDGVEDTGKMNVSINTIE
jgi:hypothetical protein